MRETCRSQYAIQFGEISSMTKVASKKLTMLPLCGHVRLSARQTKKLAKFGSTHCGKHPQVCAAGLLFRPPTHFTPLKHEVQMRLALHGTSAGGSTLSGHDRVSWLHGPSNCGMCHCKLPRRIVRYLLGTSWHSHHPK